MRQIEISSGRLVWPRGLMSALALAGLLLLPGSAAAATISGFVRDGASGESLPFAIVYLQGESRGTSANESGYFAISGVPPGTYTLAVSLIGYHTATREVVVGDEDLVLNTVLREDAIRLGATVVEASREEIEAFDISPGRTTLRVDELKAAPAAIEADPIRTLQTLPGVATLSDFSVGLYVRGGTPDQNLVLLDGTDVYNASHMFGLFSTFPADAAKSTELLRGGYPAKYGGRLSSVLNVITNEGNKERIQASGGASILASRLTLQGPVGRGSWLVSGRRTHLDPLLSLARRKLKAKRFAYNFYDLQGKTHQVLSHSDQLTLAGYTGRDALVYRFDEFDFDLQWGNRTLSSRWTHIFGPTLFSNFLLTGSRFESRTGFNTEDTRLGERNRLTDLSLKGDLNWFVSNRHSVEAGVLIKRMSMEYIFGERTVDWVDLDVEAYHDALYAQDTWKVTPRLTLQPGLRFNYFTNGSYSGWSPRLSARYALAGNTQLKGAVGLYHQYIFRLAREFQGISLLSNIWALADSSASPSQAVHYIAGIETQQAGIDIDAEVYYKDYDGLYEINYDEQNSVIIGDILRRGPGRAYGFDILVRKRAGRQTGWLSLSTSASERTIDDLNLDADGRERPFKSKFDRSVIVNLVHSWQVGERWTLNTRYAYSTGQPYTQVFGRGEIELPSQRRWSFQDRGELNGVRLPSYQRLDMALQKRWDLGHVELLGYLQIVNLMNHKNIFNYFWSDGDAARRKPGQRREIQMLPLLPSFGLDFEF